jgi:hypothetical protein
MHDFRSNQARLHSSHGISRRTDDYAHCHLGPLERQAMIVFCAEFFAGIFNVSAVVASSDGRRTRRSAAPFISVPALVTL